MKLWLKGDPDRHVTTNDFWHRLSCGGDDLKNLQKAIIAPVGHENAVVAPNGLVHAFILMQFFEFFYPNLPSSTSNPQTAFTWNITSSWQTDAPICR